MLIAFLPFTFIRCKKIEMTPLRPAVELARKQRSSPVKRFFGTKSQSPELAAIAGKLMRREEQKPFIEKFVEYAGFPMWDKSITKSRKSIGSGLARSSGIPAEDRNVYLMPELL